MILKDEYILFKLGKITRTVRLCTPDKPRFTFPDERKADPLVFTHDFNVFADDLLSPLLASNDLHTRLTISIKNDILELIKEDETDKFSAIIKDIKINKSKGSIEMDYNSDFIYSVLSKSKDKVNIKISQNAPIKITNNLYRNFTFKYMIAPLTRLD